MERLLEGLWNPLLGGFVLCAGLLLLLGTGVLPLRRLGRVTRGWSVGTPSGPAVLLATSASLTTVTAAVFAVGLGGPGALVWMWIAAVLGMGLHFGEAKLARRPSGDAKPGLPTWTLLGTLAVALLAGGLWQGNQAGAVLEASFGLPAVFGAATVAAVALGTSRRTDLTNMAMVWWPLLGIGLAAGLLAAAIFRDPLALQLALGDAVNQAFGLQSASAGTVSGALSVLIAHGMMRAVSAADIGAGAAAAAATLSDDPQDADDAGASLMPIPMIAVGVLSTLAGLAILAAPTESPLSEPKDPAKSDAPHIVNLERTVGRKLRASKQVGQTVVLREDTTMEKGKQYGMMLRADPRGHKMAKLLDRENAVVLPKWAIAEDVDTVYLRPRNTQEARHAAWDVAIPCNRELFGGKDGAPQFVRLTPKDPEVEFKALANYYELDPQPYVNVGNAEFAGAVALANSPDDELGQHLAMFEYRGEDTAFNPRLHEFFRNQFSGPFAAEETETPPRAFIAKEGFDAPIGSRVKAELRADPRGIDILRVNRAGGTEAPPWNALLDLHEIVIRHADGPSADIRVPVAARLDGKRIRLDILDPAWKDMRKVAADEKLSGPFAAMSDVPIELEVHGDTRLPDAAKSRLALVPVHPDVRPRGPQERDLYDPHPSELIAVGFGPPRYPAHDVAALVRRVESVHPYAPRVFGFAALLLAATTALGWSLLIRRPAERLFGPAAGVLLPLLVCVLPVLGGFLSASWAQTLALLAYAVAIVPVLGLLVVHLSRVRDSSRS